MIFFITQKHLPNKTERPQSEPDNPREFSQTHYIKSSTASSRIKLSGLSKKYLFYSSPVCFTPRFFCTPFITIPNNRQTSNKSVMTHLYKFRQPPSVRVHRYDEPLQFTQPNQMPKDTVFRKLVTQFDFFYCCLILSIPESQEELLNRKLAIVLCL